MFQFVVTLRPAEKIILPEFCIFPEASRQPRWGEKSVPLALDYFWDSKVRCFRIRRLLQDLPGHVAWNHSVFAQSGVGGLVVGQHLGHWLDLGSVQLIELPDVLENLINLFAVTLQLGFAQVQIGQFGYAFYFFTADLHGILSVPPEPRFPWICEDISFRCNYRPAPGTPRPIPRRFLRASHPFSRRCRSGNEALRRSPAN